MSTKPHYAGAVADLIERLEYEKPDSESYARELAQEQLREYLDTKLIYKADILDLWDGDTHPDIYLGQNADIMDAITASTYHQLCDEWQDAIPEAVETYVIRQHGDSWEDRFCDLDEALATDPEE